MAKHGREYFQKWNPGRKFLGKLWTGFSTNPSERLKAGKRPFAKVIQGSLHFVSLDISLLKYRCQACPILDALQTSKHYLPAFREPFHQLLYCVFTADPAVMQGTTMAKNSQDHSYLH